jgi:phosphoribosylformylglycinamidine synthase
MAILAIDEAVRNVVAVGADPDKIAILDNFCWGNTDKADRLGGLVRAAKGCHDAAIALGTPFISGKDSLNNEYREEEESVPVTPTLLITAVAHVPDVTRTVSMDLKSPQDRIVLLGQTASDLGGSHYYRLLEEKGLRAPRLHPAEAKDLYRALHQMIQGGLVRACHDLSEGGLAIAAAEMAIGGSLGLDISLRDVPIREGMDYDFMILFSETPSRFLLEVPEENLGEVRSILGEIPFAPIGKVSEDDRIRITGREGQEMVNLPVHQARRAWKEPLYRIFGEEG